MTRPDWTSGRDLYQIAQANNWRIEKNGSYFEIYDDDGVLVDRAPDSARCLPKETRSSINAALVKAGLLVAAVLGALLIFVVT